MTKIYLVKTAKDGEGARFRDESDAKRAAASLKRAGYKRVRIVTRTVK